MVIYLTCTILIAAQMGGPPMMSMVITETTKHYLIPSLIVTVLSLVFGLIVVAIWRIVAAENYRRVMLTPPSFVEPGD
ncbi:MAG: hypothetical protein ACRC8S_14345 [Fimbriiglobus sp.]